MLPIVAVTAAAAFAWRSVWIGAAGILILAVPLLFRLLSDAGKPRPLAAGADGEPVAESYSRAAMLRDRRFYLIVPALLGPSFIVTGLFSIRCI